MTNDTSTLNGALRELGETMAANLTTQGVTSTWDEGLTTLAGKILDITPGPGPTPSFDGISLTGNKNILSAADSEYVTLEAQLTDSGSAAAVSGETVTFTVYKSSDDSVVTTLTDDTDSSGLATVSYYGEGTGDIYIKSSANSILSDPYSIEDCHFYDSLTSDRSLFTFVQGRATLSYSSNGLKYTGTSTSGDTYHRLIHDLPTTDYKLEYIVTDATTSGYCSEICVEDTRLGWNSGDGINCYKISGGAVFNSHTNYNVPNTIRIEVTGSTSKTIKWYKDNTLLGQGSSITQNRLFRLKTYNNRKIQIKDLKVKPL